MVTDCVPFSIFQNICLALPLILPPKKLEQLDKQGLQLLHDQGITTCFELSNDSYPLFSSHQFSRFYPLHKFQKKRLLNPPGSAVYLCFRLVSSNIYVHNFIILFVSDKLPHREKQSQCYRFIWWIPSTNDNPISQVKQSPTNQHPTLMLIIFDPIIPINSWLVV